MSSLQHQHQASILLSLREEEQQKDDQQYLEGHGELVVTEKKMETSIYI